MYEKHDITLDTGSAMWYIINKTVKCVTLTHMVEGFGRNPGKKKKPVMFIYKPGGIGKK